MDNDRFDDIITILEKLKEKEEFKNINYILRDCTVNGIELEEVVIRN